MTIPKRVSDRMTAALKRLIPIIRQQASRDISEADTVTLVKDLLSQAFGFDKYAELTGEFAIRGTFCDLGVKINEKLIELIEVKAVGIRLDDRHLRQVVDYAANQGVEWVILTNAVTWRLYNVVFSKPIDKRLVAELDMSAIDPRRKSDREVLYLFTKEGFQKGVHELARDRQVATSRYLLAALLLHNDNVLRTIKRELRRVVDVKVDEDQIAKVLREEVIKRDTLEDPKAERAVKRVNRTEDRPLRSRRRKSQKTEPPVIETTVSDSVKPITSAPTATGSPRT